MNGVRNDVKTKEEIAAKERERNDQLNEAQTLAAIKRIEAGDNADSDLDMYFVKNNGWKDDISFYIFLSPALLAFFPSMVPHIQAGFDVLENMPVWYQIALAMMLVAVWGYRRMVRPIVESFLKRKMGIL